MARIEPLRLAPEYARCPRCRKMPPLRIQPPNTWFLYTDPREPVLSIECRCGHRYNLVAAAFQQAA